MRYPPSPLTRSAASTRLVATGNWCHRPSCPRERGSGVPCRWREQTARCSSTTSSRAWLEDRVHRCSQESVTGRHGGVHLHALPKNSWCKVVPCKPSSDLGHSCSLLVGLQSKGALSASTRRGTTCSRSRECQGSPSKLPRLNSPEWAVKLVDEVTELTTSSSSGNKFLG